MAAEALRKSSRKKAKDSGPEFAQDLDRSRVVFCTVIIKMGGGASKASYATLEKTVIGDDKWVTFCETYDLTLQEQSEFFALWSRMDRKRRGEVNAA